MSDTSYTYNPATGDISFTLGHSITVSLATQDSLTFTLSDNGTFQQMGGSPLPGADSSNSFTVATSEISGDFTISADMNSTHAVAFDGGSTTYSMKKFTINIGNATVSFNDGVKIMASDKIDIKTMRNISMNNVATGTTQMLSGAKGVSLVANENGKPNIGASNGIYIGLLNSIEVPVGSGTIELSLKGRGDKYGVSIYGGNVTNNVGTVMITGTGGSASVGFNRGVSIQGSSTVKGNGVTIIGNGGVNATGTENVGIFIGTSSSIDAGTSLAATLTGTGGSGTGLNRGVNIQGSSTVKGNGVAIIGNGGTSATGTSNTGIFIGTSSSVDAGTMLASLTGTGGSGTDTNQGVTILNSSTVKGNGVTIIGNGGAKATGAENMGIFIDTTSSIDAGTALASLTGTGGSGTDFNLGVNIQGSSTVKGNRVTITGDGGTSATGAANTGIVIIASSVDAGTMLASLTGTGGSGTNTNRGVTIQARSTVKGNRVTIIGNGGAKATGAENMGIFIIASSVDAGTMLASLTGTGGSGTNTNRGVTILNSSTVKGNGVAIIGNGGTSATGTSNHGITVIGNAKITGIANDTMTGSASVVLTGTSGSGTEDNRGVDIRLGGIVESTDGDVDITGLSMKTTVKTNHGIAIEILGDTTNVPAQVTALKGKIKLTGTGGGGIDSYGTLVDNSGIVEAKEIIVVGKASSSYGVVQQKGGNFIGNVTIDSSSKEYFPNTAGQDVNGNIIVESPLLIIIKSLGDNTQLTSSGKITLSKSRLIIDDSAHMSSDGDTYTIVSSGASIDRFNDYNDLSIVTGTSGQRYIIDYSTTKIMLIREFDFEPEPEPDCTTGVRIDLDLDLNISGQIRGQICLPRRLLC